MKLTWNIVRKDLARIWLPWLIWVALVVADIGLGSRMIRGDLVNQATQYEADVYRRAINGLFVIVGYILAAWLVQLDCPLNSESEWMTRPISGARLFAAKAFGVFLLMWAPILLIAVIWWFGSGLLPGQMPFLAVVTITLCGAVTLPSFFLASVSKDWARFLLVTVGVAMLLVFSQYAGLSSIVFGLGANAFLRSLKLDLIWILFTALIVATFVLFTSRRIWRASGIVAVGILVAALLSRRFEITDEIASGAESTILAPAGAEPLPKGIQVSFERAQIFNNPRRPWTRYAHRPQWPWPVVLSMRIEGTPAGEIFRYEIFDGELNISGVTNLIEQWESFLYSKESPALFTLAVLGLKADPLEFDEHLFLNRSIATKALVGPTSLHGKIYLRRMVSKIEAKLPLTAGSSRRIWGSTVTVVNTQIYGNDDDSEHISPWTLTSLVNFVGPSYQEGNSSYSEAEFGAFVFWNEELAEAAYATESTLASASVQGVRLERKVLAAQIPIGKNATREKAEKWIGGARLVWVGFSPKQYYWTPLDVPSLKILSRNN